MCMQTVVVGLAVSYLHFVAMLPPDSLLEIRRDRVLDLSNDPLEPHPLIAPNLAKDRAAASSELLPTPSRRAQASAPPDLTPAAPSLPARQFKMPAVRAQRAVP